MFSLDIQNKGTEFLNKRLINIFLSNKFNKKKLKYIGNFKIH